MSDFFTGIPTGNMEFPKTTVMMLDLSLLLAAVLLIILSKKYLNFTRFLKIIGILLLFEFFIINIWYWLAPFWFRLGLLSLSFSEDDSAGDCPFGCEQ